MSVTEDNLSKTVGIVNQRGLHARASARFATEAGRYNAVVAVSKDGVQVTGTSIMGLMMLGAAKGDEIIISADGDEAFAAVEALSALVSNRFGEAE
ncbi:HPr family phosphocarrier protein [Kordiimonas aestuarii]|uniref:HPr family phosphocarrier protein n=1 Tax=Kordiimonas aestuarii TaxID=1005925 RepID=UPI0021D21175|nr:HPr family phosphocarrier protein [Kordiimonas aestuarii]